MRKRVQIALAVLLAAVFGVIAWQVLCPQEREPLHQGKRLSLWLEILESGQENLVGVQSLVREVVAEAGGIDPARLLPRLKQWQKSVYRWEDLVIRRAISARRVFR